MAKIAVDLARAVARRQQDGTPGRATSSLIAQGDGWSVADVVCTSGPQDRPFEEAHTHFAIAMVLAGTFEYRSPRGAALMTPGSLMLANAGECYECGHAHGAGDRCVSFWFTAEYLERLCSDVGRHRAHAGFDVPRVPPARTIAPLVASVAAGVTDSHATAWEEIGLRLAAHALGFGFTTSSSSSLEPAHAASRVAEIVRAVERTPDATFSLDTLADRAGLSPFHFLRTFERLTGATPHQYLLRARLREAALRLNESSDRIIDIALGCGFGDVSNFNRAFRAEFGVAPRAYRTRRRPPTASLSRAAY